MFAFCSMVSGWYGMNLDNGTCGPDGCNDFAIAGATPFFTDSLHGYANFVGAAAGSSLAVLLAGGATAAYIRRLL